MAGISPAFSFYPQDWLSSPSVRAMPHSARGMYIDLLCLQWVDADCSLPNDTVALARMVGGDPSEFNKHWDEHLQECFTKVGAGPGRIRLRNMRLYREFQTQKTRREQASAAGKASAKSRGNKTKNDRSNSVGTKRQRKPNLSSSSSSSSSVSSSGESGSLRNLSSSRVSSTDIDAVIEHYREHHPKSRPGEADRRRIAARIREGYSADDLRRAIDGCHKSPHHCGENPGGKLYQSLELITRDSKHVQQFLEISENGPGVVLSEKSQRTLRSVEGYCEEMGYIDAE